jgi:hypothetical protein
MWQEIGKNTYVFNSKFPGGEVIVICARCNRDAMRYEDISENMRCEIYSDRSDVQASVGSAIKRSARSVKAGLGHRVVLGMELERDGVSRHGALKKETYQHKGRYIMTAWLTNDVRWIIEKACSIVANIDIMGCWGGR